MSFENQFKDLDDLDFDEDDDEEEEEIEEKAASSSHKKKNDYSTDIDALSDDDNEGDAMERDINDLEGDNDEDNDDDDEQIPSSDSKDIVKLVTAKLSSSVGAFRKSTKYQNQLNIIKQAIQRGDGDNQQQNGVSTQLNSGMTMINIGNLETDAEYQLILDCNRLIHDIDDEIAETHRFVVDCYAQKFPELEQFIPNKLDYVQTVLRIQNETDMTVVELNDILPSSTVMIVSVTGSTTAGHPLSETDLQQCLKACREVLALLEDKSLVLQYVESRMSHLAPNLTACIGSRVSAQLVGLAGGITALSKIPACNVMVMGQEKRNLAGFSNVAALPHTGILYQCDLIQQYPHSVRRKALKIVANKVILLARIDSYANYNTNNSNSANGSSSTSSDMRRLHNSQGVRLKQEIEDAMDRVLEPSKARTKKALPIPEEKKRSKRGGKRVRKQKERYAMTELRAQHNKMSFGPTSGGSGGGGEYSDSAMGLDSGMIGSKDSGKLRSTLKKEVSLVKKQKLKGGGSSSASNMNNANASSLSMIKGSRSTATSGLASSLSFTPVQGIELINPTAAADRVKEANNKWFSAQSGFLSAAPGAGASSSKKII